MPRVTKPTLIKTQVMAEREATYNAALALVGRIDDDLDRDVRHYRNRSGVLLTRLNEIVDAILSGELAEPERMTG